MLALQQQAAMMQAAASAAALDPFGAYATGSPPGMVAMGISPMQAQLNAALDSAPPAQEHAPPRDAGAAACGYAQRAWSQDMGFEAARLLLWEASSRNRLFLKAERAGRGQSAGALLSRPQSRARQQKVARVQTLVARACRPYPRSMQTLAAGHALGPTAGAPAQHMLRRHGRDARRWRPVPTPLINPLIEP